MGRVAFVVAVVAVAVGTLGGCGHGASTAPGADAGASAKPPAASTVRTISIKVRGGKASGDTGRIAVPQGTPIVLSVSSDVADEIHVHGYDLKKDVSKGGSVTFNFKATIEGRFEVELENAGTQIANLEVTPS